MTYKIDSEHVQGIVHKAILDSISPEAREKILSDAVANLLVAPRRDSYGLARKAPLEEAFDNAVITAALAVTREMIANDAEVQAKIREMVGASVAQIAAGNYRGLPEAIGSAVANWLQEQRRD